MPTLILNGRHVDVDIRYELEQFEWTRPTWTEDRLLAASPFRYDRTPSFYVYLEDTASAKAGYWGDSGAYDAEFARAAGSLNYSLSCALKPKTKLSIIYWTRMHRRLKTDA
ncbi:hypothetical protein [Bacillus velezensis]|uniref:hypothetical protein n=1 Tax=Bacillus velezensis TaxID=492670 RepID=UPI001E619CE7|nr:hypothetical protein [Bacillus velezensis]